MSRGIRMFLGVATATLAISCSPSPAAPLTLSPTPMPAALTPASTPTAAVLPTLPPALASTPAAPASPSPTGGQVANIQLTSSAFAPGAPIPRLYTCDDKNISPPLQWSDPPRATQSIALITDDPDAGGFVHWVVYNLPATARSLPQATQASPDITGGGKQGKNDFGKIGYGGPCPPSGTHRYSFRLYALDGPLDLPSGASSAQVTRAMQGHILSQAEVIGMYTRQK